MTADSRVLERPYYSHALPRTGTPVFLTGQVAWDETGAIVGRNDIAAQAAQVWANVTAVVTQMGATLGDIVKITTYATDRAFIPALHAERAKHFAPGTFPASTFLVVAGLAEADLLVEIEVVLVLPAAHPALSGE